MQVFVMGWKMGLEPTTFGTTIRRSNQLSYVHHVAFSLKRGCKDNTNFVPVQDLSQKIREKIVS